MLPCPQIATRRWLAHDHVSGEFCHQPHAVAWADAVNKQGTSGQLGLGNLGTRQKQQGHTCS